MSTLAYKFSGAGHEMPGERRKYEEPDKRLSEAFEKWMETRESHTENDYKRAKELIEGIEVTAEHAHALLVKYQDHPRIKKSGEFLSAVYNKSTDKVIVYDLDMPVDMLGYRLDGKTFVNNGTIGTYLCAEARCDIINNGTTEMSMGHKAEVNMINNGTTGSSAGWQAKGNIINNGKMLFWVGKEFIGNIINNGTTAEYAGSKLKGLFVNNGETDFDLSDFSGIPRRNVINLAVTPGFQTENIPALKQYSDNLKAQLTNPNIAEVLKVLESLTPKRLSKEINARLGYMYRIKRFFGLEGRL